jgi:hypothetical protein
MSRNSDSSDNLMQTVHTRANQTHYTMTCIQGSQCAQCAHFVESVLNEHLKHTLCTPNVNCALLCEPCILGTHSCKRLHIVHTYDGETLKGVLSLYLAGLRSNRASIIAQLHSQICPLSLSTLILNSNTTRPYQQVFRSTSKSHFLPA